MAKSGSFSSRFPHFKLFLFLAVVIALPLTVFSVQKVSTSTEQHASLSSTCGPNNQNPSCGAGGTCSFTAGNPSFGGTCIYPTPTKSPSAPSPTKSPQPPLKQATGLKATGACTAYYRNGKPAALSVGDYTLSWNPVANRGYYGVHVISSKGAYFNYKVTAAKVHFAPSFLQGTTFNWQVIAYSNSNSNVQSPLAQSKLTPNCKRINY